jgi:multimeric flavodoxin WrbA
MTKKNQTAIILNGSPRPKGNTALLVSWIEEALKKAKYHYQRYDLYPLNIQGCAHCDACKKVLDRPNCVLPDQFSKILEEILNSNLVILASPIYCWSVSGSLSSALDRFYALFKRGDSLMVDKKFIGAFTAGGDYFDGMDLAVERIKRICEYGKANYLGTVGAINCEKPEDLEKQQELKVVIDQLIMGE